MSGEVIRQIVAGTIAKCRRRKLDKQDYRAQALDFESSEIARALADHAKTCTPARYDEDLLRSGLAYGFLPISEHHKLIERVLVRLLDEQAGDVLSPRVTEADARSRAMTGETA